MVETPRRAYDVRTDVATGATLLVRGLDAFELDEVSAQIWTLCDGAHTVDQIAGEIVARYEVDGSQAEQDVRDFLADLDRAGLLDK